MSKAGDTPQRYGTSRRRTGQADEPATPTASNVIDARELFSRRRKERDDPSAGCSRGSPGRDSSVAPPRRPYQSVPPDGDHPEEDEEFLEIGFEEPEADGPFSEVPGEDYGVGRKWT